MATTSRVAETIKPTIKPTSVSENKNMNGICIANNIFIYTMLEKQIKVFTANYFAIKKGTK
jgi:hypothetical protein